MHHLAWSSAALWAGGCLRGALPNDTLAPFRERECQKLNQSAASSSRVLRCRRAAMSLSPAATILLASLMTSASMTASLGILLVLNSQQATLGQSHRGLSAVIRATGEGKSRPRCPVE